ncbi:MAG: hypothetical protein ACFB02_22565 [Mastigocoleus sp.]
MLQVILKISDGAWAPVFSDRIYLSIFPLVKNIFCCDRQFYGRKKIGLEIHS